MTKTIAQEQGSAPLAGRPVIGKKHRDGRRRAILLLAGSTVAVVVASVAGLAGGLRLNLTPSEPVGLWRIEGLDRPAEVGDLLFICPPPGKITTIGLERGYFRSGLCPGGVGPLIKSVAAVAGAGIEIGGSVVIDGRPLPSSLLAPVDGAGRRLPPWHGGRVPPGHLFLHSPFRGSYDSRYFGPIPENGVLGLARPVFTAGS